MTFPQQYKSELLQAIDTIDLDKVNEAIELFRDARANGRRIFVCGNGGSASTASHFACDIVKGASFNRQSRFRIMALTDQLPTLTAYANDVSYDAVFVEQLKNFAEPGDLFLGISGSGNSQEQIPRLGEILELLDEYGVIGDIVRVRRQGRQLIGKRHDAKSRLPVEAGAFHDVAGEMGSRRGA